MRQVIGGNLPVEVGASFFSDGVRLEDTDIDDEAVSIVTDPILGSEGCPCCWNKNERCE